MFNNLHFRKRDLYQSSNLNKQLGKTYASFRCYYNHCRTEYAIITGSFWHCYYLTGLFIRVENYSSKFIETIVPYTFRILFRTYTKTILKYVLIQLIFLLTLKYYDMGFSKHFVITPFLCLYRICVYLT